MKNVLNTDGSTSSFESWKKLEKNRNKIEFIRSCSEFRVQLFLTLKNIHVKMFQ